MYRVRHSSLLLPNFIAPSVLDIKPDQLKTLKISHIVFDIDETIVPKRHNELTPEYITFLQNLEEQGFTILIGSNTKRDLQEITQHLKAEVVRPSRFAFKPLKRYYKRIIDTAHVDPHHIVMVGDKVLNDVIGANRAGLHSILVKPYARRQGGLYKLYSRLYINNS